MNILEALVLARDHGKRVKPVSWPRSDGLYVAYRDGGFSVDEDGRFVAWVTLRCEAELLGEWESVEP